MKDTLNSMLGILMLLAIAAVIVVIVMYVGRTEQRPRTSPMIYMGKPLVTDGDTLRIGDTRIRLKGIDAEEMNEPNGPAAKDAMLAVVGRGDVFCTDTGERSYNRIVAWCVTALGDDIGAKLVSMGAVLDCARYSGGRYRSLEPAGIRSKLRQKRYCE